jgi:hypothetical protein
MSKLNEEPHVPRVPNDTLAAWNHNLLIRSTRREHERAYKTQRNEEECKGASGGNREGQAVGTGKGVCACDPCVGQVQGRSSGSHPCIHTSSSFMGATGCRGGREARSWARGDGGRCRERTRREVKGRAGRPLSGPGPGAGQEGQGSRAQPAANTAAGTQQAYSRGP